MLFNSLPYVVFLPLVTAAYFLLPPRRRWVLLLAASYWFYMSWKLEYGLLLAASTLLDYWAGLRMGAAGDPRGRRKYLHLSLAANLGLLFAFKYLDFAGDSLRQLFAHVDLSLAIPRFDLLLPVGISFFTFQKLSYTISVYRGKHPPERHLGLFALYVSFFPQLVAGPIGRSGDLLPQHRAEHRFDYRRAADGLKLIAWGMFKKVVIADRAAVLVASVYGQPQDFQGPQLALATLFYAFQIYCDFSGYSDIAIGSGLLLGYRLPLNFDRPYHARSIGEFWKRWHISLSNWLRDYVFLPVAYATSRRLPGERLLGLKAEFWIYAAATMVTMLACGVWHGAAWTFVIWGALHGAYLLLENLTKPWRHALARRAGVSRTGAPWTAASVVLTFGLTCFAWIFFRAGSLADAWYVAGHVGEGLGGFLRAALTLDLGAVELQLRGLGLSQRDLVILVLAIAGMELVHLAQIKGSLRDLLARRPAWVRWALYYGVVAAILFLGAFNRSQQFIYFQF